MSLPRRLLLLPVALTSLALLPGLRAQSGTATAPSTAPRPVFEEWVVLVLDGKQCGFGSTVTKAAKTPGGDGYETELQEEFVVKRLGVSLKLNEVSHITEDAQGAVLSFDQVSSGMGSDIESKGTRNGDDLVVTSRGQTQTYHIPRLAALGPEAIRRQTDAVPLKPGQAFTLNTFITDYPQAVAVEEGSVVDREEHDVRGTKQNLWKIVSDMPVMPGIKSTIWVDDQDNDVETVITIPGLGAMHQYVTDRAECMKQPEGAEIFATSLIAPQQALPSPIDGQYQATYRVSTESGTGKLNLWNGGEQRVLTSEPGSSEIEVTVPTYTAQEVTWKLPHADSPELHQFLQPTAYLEAGSPEIVALARSAIGAETNPVLAAHKIEQFVRAYIVKKDLNVGFASAEETAKSREGDCTEHAVLCAAIGRAAGLPTRCVLGLGYIPPGEAEPTISNEVDTKTGIFGFHMWAEAWIGPDQWVPMDAALDGFDIGHIAILKSALADIDPMVDLNVPILQLMQNLKITVVKTVPFPGRTPTASLLAVPALSSPPPAGTSTAPQAISAPVPSTSPPSTGAKSSLPAGID